MLVLQRGGCLVNIVVMGWLPVLMLQKELWGLLGVSKVWIWLMVERMCAGRRTAGLWWGVVGIREVLWWVDDVRVVRRSRGTRHGVARQHYTTTSTAIASSNGEFITVRDVLNSRFLQFPSQKRSLDV